MCARPQQMGSTLSEGRCRKIRYKGPRQKMFLRRGYYRGAALIVFSLLMAASAQAASVGGLQDWQSRSGGALTFLQYPNYRGLLFDDYSQIIKLVVDVIPDNLKGSPVLANLALTVKLTQGSITAATVRLPSSGFGLHAAGRSHCPSGASCNLVTIDGSRLAYDTSYTLTASVTNSHGALFTQPAHETYRVVRRHASDRSSMKVFVDQNNIINYAGHPTFVLGSWDGPDDGPDPCARSIIPGTLPHADLMHDLSLSSLSRTTRLQEYMNLVHGTCAQSEISKEAAYLNSVAGTTPKLGGMRETQIGAAHWFFHGLDGTTTSGTPRFQTTAPHFCCDRTTITGPSTIVIKGAGNAAGTVDLKTTIIGHPDLKTVILATEPLRTIKGNADYYVWDQGTYPHHRETELRVSCGRGAPICPVELQTAIAKVSARLTNVPAYYIYDEETPDVAPVLTAQVINMAKSDPYSIIYGNINANYVYAALVNPNDALKGLCDACRKTAAVNDASFVDLMYYRDAGDVIADDSLPFNFWNCYDPSRHVSYVNPRCRGPWYIPESAQWIYWAKEAVQGSRPIYGQMDFYAGSGAGGTWPNLQQMHDQAWTYVVAGVQGLYYSKFTSLFVSPAPPNRANQELYFGTISKELGDINDALVSEDDNTALEGVSRGPWDDQVLSANPHIRVKLKSSQSGSTCPVERTCRWVFAYNDTSDLQSNVKFTLASPLSTVTRYGAPDTGRPRIRGNSFTDTFGTFEAHASRILDPSMAATHPPADLR